MPALDHELLIFDFDGTLADSTAAIADLFLKSIDVAGLTPVAHSEVRSRVGLSLWRIASELYGVPEDHEYCTRLADTYRELCYSGSLEEVELFPGVLSLLRDLHESGRKLAIATGKSLKSLQIHLDAYDLAPLFCSLGTSDRVEKAKPDPEMLELVLKESGVPRERSLVIGDTSFDLEMARAAKVASMAVTYGSHSTDELLACEPDHVAGTVEELRELLIGGEGNGRDHG